MAAAFSTGAQWGFPDDLPGGWVKVDNDDADEQLKREAGAQPPPPPKPQQQQKQQKRRTHYPARQCRICLETILPTFHNTDTTTSVPLPGVFQSTPRVTYESPFGDGGRLLRPCRCKGSQKYVHEECLSAWRFQDPLQKRNYWQCPTCSYKYRLERLRWSAWISSGIAQVALTLLIFFTGMFILGFVADPIINLYIDPVTTIAHAGAGPTGSLIFEDEPPTWTEHFIKGLASLGLLGFAKFLLTLSPWHWFNMRGGFYSGGGRAGTTGRDRLNQISWITILIGIATVLYAVWKGVRAYSRRVLERAGEKVMDGPGNADDDDDEEEMDGDGSTEEQQRQQQ